MIRIHEYVKVRKSRYNHHIRNEEIENIIGLLVNNSLTGYGIVNKNINSNIFNI